MFILDSTVLRVETDNLRGWICVCVEQNITEKVCNGDLGSNHCFPLSFRADNDHFSVKNTDLSKKLWVK